MKKIVFFLLIVIIASCSKSDSDEQLPEAECLTIYNEVVLTTQAEVDAFAAMRPCNINYLFTIGNKDGVSDITDLSGLSTIKSVKILTIINNPLLTSLNGLENITSAQYIEINNNVTLDSLEGIGSIINIATDVNQAGYHIISNPMLQNLNGLRNVQQMGTLQIDNCAGIKSLHGIENSSITDLSISNCPLLTNIDALSNKNTIQNVSLSYNATLNSIQGLQFTTKLVFLTIDNCQQLVSLDGLNNLTESAYVALKNLTALTSLDALHNMSSVIDFDCINNTALTSLDGMQGLTKIPYLTIDGCNSLSTLNGLQNVTEINYLNILNNPALVSLDAFSTSLVKIAVQHVNPNESGMRIINNDALATLNGFEHVTSYDGGIQIFGNASLIDFCALHNIAIVYPLTETTIIYDNLNPGYANPPNGQMSMTNILQGNCN